MDYQQTKIAYVRGFEMNKKRCTSSLKRTTAFINKLRQVHDSTLTDLLSDFLLVDLSNFLEDVVSVLLEQENKKICTIMKISIRLSFLYEEFDCIFL